MKKHLFIFLLSLSGFLPSPSIADTWSDWIPNFKKSVVNIEAHVEVSLGRNESGIFYGTGFIVDAERGLVVTNQHIAGSSPISFLKISFNNGAAVEGRMIYFDPWHDFAFVQFDPRRLSFIPQAVRLGSHQQLKENEELMLIGNNELESYSIKRGRVTKLFVNKGFNDPARHSHYIHSDFDRTGGSSGSPVWNKKGEVIGIHAGGTDTSSFELRIDYVVDALKKIQQDKIPERGDLQISLETLSLTNAKDYFSYVPTPTLQTAKAGVDPQYILQVKDVLLGSPASQLLKIGDIVVAIEGKTIGADLYEFDRLVDEKFANNKTAGRELQFEITDFFGDVWFASEMDERFAKGVFGFTRFKV
jgi:S1-C subfamily serine protease